MAENTLKLCGAVAVPGMALPKAFEEVEKKLESVASLCRMKCSYETQTASLLTVCSDLQRLLKLAFIENGMLASRIEILARYQGDTIKKFEKKQATVELEHRITRRYLKQLRKRQSAFESVRRSREKEWWDVVISCSDYDSLSTLSRSCGNPDLEFMLRVNQLMLDFVKDKNKNELQLPPMGGEERNEVSRLANMYKLRCRFNKSTQVASSTLIKARQTCIPGKGEVDNMLNSYAKKHRDMEKTEGGELVGAISPRPGEGETLPAAHNTPNASSGGNDTDTHPPAPVLPPTPLASAMSSLASPPIDNKSGPTIPSHMLTPVSTLGTPTITLEVVDQSSCLSQSFTPTGSGRATPIEFSEGRVDPPASYSTSFLSENPINLSMANLARHAPSVRITKLEGKAGSLPSPLLASSDSQSPLPSSGPSSATSSSLASFSQKTSQMTSSQNLLQQSASSLSSANAALQMLLMQSSPMRMFSTSSTTTSSAASPVPPTTAVSTVVASPLPSAFSSSPSGTVSSTTTTPTTSVAVSTSSVTTTTSTSGVTHNTATSSVGSKREGSSSSSSTSKRPKTRRNPTHTSD